MWKVLLLVAGALAYDPTFYDGYKYVTYEPTTMNHINALKQFSEDNGVMPAKQNELLISADKMDQFKFIARSVGLAYKVAERDIGSELKAEWDRMLARGYPNKMAYDINDYNTLTDINNEVDNLATQCQAGINCTVSNIGTTVDGRDHRVLSMSGGSGRQGILVDSLIHAREWLAGATGMNILDKMVKEYGIDADVTTLLDNYDFHFISVNNPDGYEFTWTDDRLWRKNRRDNTGSNCFGVDLNRNYDCQWSGPGASGNPCAADYYGSSANSEPETQNVAAWALANPNVNADVSLHCYGYYLLAPYGNCTRPPGWTDELWPVMRDYCSALENHEAGNQWDCGNSCNDLYRTSGGSTDWMMDTAQMTYAFVTECRGNSFVEPVSQIPESFQENWTGLVAMVQQMILQAAEP